jgi:glutathione S-transferase
MYQLYYFPGNANLAAHMVLEEIGAPHELRLVDRTSGDHKSPDYLRLNPHGRLPTLVDGDLVLFETAAICLHLIDHHAEAGLAPKPGTAARAHFYKWLVYLTNTVQAEMLVYFYPERWAAGAAGATDVRRHAEAHLAEMLDRIETSLAASGPYLLGPDFSAADLYLLMLGRWSRGFNRPARTRTHLGRLMEKVMARPAVQRAFAAEGLAAPFY